jgi:hypothetical protein
MPRGGYRDGAGRKPADESGAQSPIQVWISPALLERLDVAKDALGISRGAVLDMGVKEAERRAKRNARAEKGKVRK